MSIQLTPFLSLSGKAKEAIRFYEKHLGAKVLFMKDYKGLKEMDPTFEYIDSQAEYIAHSVLKIGSSILMAGDEIMSDDKNEIIGTNFSFCIQSNEKEEIENMYNSLVADENVKIIVPLAPNIFSHVYGIVKDPFGIVIQLVAEKEMDVAKK